MIHDGLYHAIDILQHADIHWDEDRLAARGLDQFHFRLHAFDPPGGQNDPGAFGGKQVGGIPAKAGGCAGDHDNFPLERDRHIASQYVK